jgi:type III restriction enzyme
MRYALKEYQEEAVRDVVRLLRDAKDDYRIRQRRSAFALSATTGAGKTVIASAVIEALFQGSDDLDVEPDPTAVVLWVTDDPSLNEQTRYRMIAAADRLDVGQLITIGNGTGTAVFDQEKLEPHRVYFLNVQKFRTGSTWIRHTNERTYTLWDTIRNTIVDDALTLYLVLDEAHRGMRSPARDENGDARSTIVRRIINGHDDVPPVPVVWGISATIDRFNVAMREANAQGRLTYPPVNIDPARVQESGLLKDTIVLDFPNEKGNFETTMLAVAVKQAVEAARLWQEYGSAEQLPEPVRPLLVVQVPNTPSDAQLKRYLDVIFSTWPDLSLDAAAHVFGEHNDLTVGSYEIPYIQPQDVQDAGHVRVLLAKDAVSTGWDCPRAEVLFSLRPAQDKTHITQLLGRMVRTPLARRVQSDERLNAVACYLPHFNMKTAVDVANRLTGKTKPDDSDTESSIPGRKVLIAPVDLHWNGAVPPSVREFLTTLPSEPKPNPQAKPLKRLLMLAAALARDGLLDQPNETAMEALYQVLDGQLAQHRAVVDEAADDILTADISRLTASMVDQSTSGQSLQLAADARAVDDAFRVASRALGAAVANGYVRRIATGDVDADGEVDLVEATAQVAALLRQLSVLGAVEDHAEALTRQWLDRFRVNILGLSEERQATYGLIRAQARTPELRETQLPDVTQEETTGPNGELYETRPLHVLADANGNYPIGSFNDWEREVIDIELARSQVVAWYRNPSQATDHAIRVPCKVGDDWKSLQPDFIFVTRREDGGLAASIVDPHSHHLSDALAKLNGLADFAEKYGDEYQRIDSLGKNDAGNTVLLDMKDVAVRRAVRDAGDAASLYETRRARAYL